MKKLLLLFSILASSAIYASGDLLGLLSQIVINGGTTNFQNAPYYISKAMYTNGGLTFTFPSGLFPQDPYVFIGLVYQGNLGLISRYTYVAYSKSVNGITISVYDPLGLEIGSNLVEVHIFATSQDPNGQSILVN